MNSKKLPPLVSQIDLEFRSGVPIYVQIMEQIKRLASSGILTAGEQLPTVRALAQELRVNFNTVARAYRLLDEAGVISTQQGRGTYILDVPLSEKDDELRKQALKELADRYLHDASQLNATPDEMQKILSQSITDWLQSDEK